MSAPTRGIERHPRSLTDPLFAAYTDATVELRASPHATASGRRFPGSTNAGVSLSNAETFLSTSSVPRDYR